MSFKDPRDQMARWLEVLCQYRFKIVHHSCKKHSNADSLSRIPCDPTVVLWLNANFRTGFRKWKFGEKLGMFYLLNPKK